MSERAYMPKSVSQCWETPWLLFDMLDSEFGFTVDAAANPKNAKLDRYWTEELDGLKQNWENEVIFINPPFAVRDLEQWVEKAYVETRNTNTVVAMVVPVKADRAWWHNFAIKTEIRFIRGRITFEGAKSSYPGPIAILVFGKDVKPKNLSMKVK